MDRFFDLNTPDPLKGDPIIFALDDGFENGAQPFVCIRNPCKGLAVDFSGYGRCRVIGLVPQTGRSPGLSSLEKPRDLHEPGHPGQRFTKRQRGSDALENSLTQYFTVQGRPVCLCHQQGIGIQLSGDIELGHGLFPLRHDTDQLKQKYAQFRFSRMVSNFCFEAGQCFFKIAGLKAGQGIH